LGDDDDDQNDTATQYNQQHPGWRSTYLEHARHDLHRAHVPTTDGLIEGPGILQRSEGRAAVSSEQRSRSERIWIGRRRRQRHRDDTATIPRRHRDDTATREQQQHMGWRTTYREHARHGLHRAHVPSTDGLIEGEGLLQGSEGRVAVSSEQRSRSDGIWIWQRRR